jgi:DNA-directed RNA polymerase specialized sigma24 family protein
MSVEHQRPWTLTRSALDLLLRRLHAAPETAVVEYETMRRKLVTFFELRGLVAPDVLADETLDRVARRLEQGEVVEHMRAYCYGVAKRVVLEQERARARERAALDSHGPRPPAGGDAEQAEVRIAILERCLKALPQGDRALILDYYKSNGSASGETRERLAARLGITYGSLKTRAHRIRNRLERGLRKSLEGAGE